MEKKVDKIKRKRKKRINKRKKGIINNTSMVISVIMTIMILIFMGYLKYVNVLPKKYYNIIVFLMLLIIVSNIFVSFKKNIKYQIKIFFDVTMSLFTIILIILMFPMARVMNFMHKIQDDNKEYDNYYILVLKDSKYQKLEDIGNKKVGILKTNEKKYKEATDKLKEKLKIKPIEYENNNMLLDDLLNKKVESILIDGIGYYMTEDEENTNYLDKFKTLDVISLVSESNIDKLDVNVVEESFNVYISGIDTFGKIATKSRSDVNIIVTVNPNTHKVLLTSIPRDYYVQLHNTTGNKDKLTHAGVYGINKSVQTIEDLLSININYYIRVNFTTMIKMVNAIGGVDVYSDASFTATADPSCRIKKGNIHLNGKCALAFARERYAYTSGDRHRGQNQQAIIKAMINKITSNKSLVLKYDSIFSSLEGSFQTNMGTSKITALVQKQLDSMPSWNVETYNLDGKGKMTYTYSYPGQKLYVMVPNEDTVSTAKQRINSILEG